MQKNLPHFFLLFALFIFSSPAWAITYYVATGGDDARSCATASNINTPKLTLASALSCPRAGDTVEMAAGTYSGDGVSILSWTTTIPNGTSWSNPITVQCATAGACTIHPNSGQAFFWIQDGQDKYLIIDGFIIDGQNSASHGLKTSENSRHIRLQNSTVENMAKSGILNTICAGCADPANAPHNSYNEYINLDVNHTGECGEPGQQLGHGFYIETGYNLIENSTIHENCGMGVQLFRVNGINSSNYNTVRYNHIYNNGTVVSQFVAGIIVSSGVGNEVYGNYIWDTANTQDVGIWVAYRSTNAKVYDNVIHGFQYTGIRVSTESQTGAIIDNNTVYKTSGAAFIIEDDSTPNVTVRNNLFITSTNPIIETGSGNTYSTNICSAANTGCTSTSTASDLFTSAADSVFTLKEGSPAVDAGTAVTDHTCIGTCDVGAHEYGIQIAAPTDLNVTPY